jgi:hypothetical protein
MVSIRTRRNAVEGGKLKIRKGLRRKSAEKNGSYVRTVLRRESRGWRLEGEEKKGLIERRRKPRAVLVVRMNPLEKPASGTAGVI